MSACCSNYPNCNHHQDWESYPGDELDEFRDFLAETKAKSIQESKSEVEETVNRKERGASGKPHRKYGTNYTKPKKRKK